jgi:hypothetical protein
VGTTLLKASFCAETLQDDSKTANKEIYFCSVFFLGGGGGEIK